MALYAIGDVQGCREPLERLLDAIRFDPSRDHAWFTGDLVNRGPDSVGCLRLVKSLGDAATVVLGNHDLHLACLHEGLQKKKARDTLDDVLRAPDRDELVAWLRTRPLFHVANGHALVHAGLLPQWTVEQARALAAEVEACLSGPDYRDLLARMYGDRPDRWSDELRGIDRLRIVINAMTRLRMVDRSGTLALSYKEAPEDAPRDLVAWFDAPGRRSAGHSMVCGHWSALGVRVMADVVALDSGCVWGRALTAIRLEDRSLVSVPCRVGAR